MHGPSSGILCIMFDEEQLENFKKIKDSVMKLWNWMGNCAHIQAGLCSNVGRRMQGEKLNT